MKSKIRWIVVSIVLVSLAAVSVQADPLRAPDAALGLAALAPLGTGFTYQGKLEDESGPVTDDCDMEFRLYSHATDPSQVGSTIADTVPVSEGLFTVKLDFGASAFDGNARWLGIQVQCTGDPGFTDLGRQELTPTPYALYASKAPWSGLAGVPTDFADGVDNNTTYSPGTGLSLAGTTFSADTTYLQRRVSGTCGAGNAIRVINADGTVTCEAVGGSGPHDHWGETWTGSGTGLTLSGGTYGIYGSGSNAGVHGSSAAGAGVWGEGPYGYGVFGSGVIGVYGGSVDPYGQGVYGDSSDGTGVRGDSSDGTGVYGTALTTGTVGIATAASGTTYGVYGRSDSTSGTGVYGSGSGYGVYGYSSSGHGVYGSSNSDSHAGISGYNTGSGDGVSGVSLDGAGVYGTALTTGTVGIATAASGTTYGVYGRSDSTSGTGVYGSGDYGVYGRSDSTSGTGVYGDGSSYGVHGYSDTGEAGVYGESSTGKGVQGYSDDDAGVRGDSISSYGVQGYSDYDAGVYGRSNSASGYGVYGLNNSSTGVYGSGGLYGVHGSGGYGVYGEGDTGVHGAGNTYGVEGFGNTYGVYGHSESGTGVRGVGSTYGVHGSGDTYGVHGSGDTYGVWGYSSSGDGVYGSGDTGVRAYSGFGTAISAEGTGVIRSAADSVLYLSPHDMVIRQDNPGLLSVTPQTGGSVRVRNESGSGTRYLSIPVSTFGQLFGSQVYVKSLEVCYKTTAGSAGDITATTVSKNDGTGTSANYLDDFTSKYSTVYVCYTLNASTPRVPIDNSSWVQFNMTFDGSGSGYDIYIYTVKLTLTEEEYD